MEKLLLQQLKNKTNDDGNLSSQRTKNSCVSCEATQLFFVTATAKTFLINLIQDDLY